jgi:predicted helicase
MFFDRLLNEEVYVLPSFLPTEVSESENKLICLTGPGSEKPFLSLAAGKLIDLHLSGGGCSTQCFPFYTYAEDGSDRRENITDWALEQFRARYHDPSISKWDIFHYIYAVLHHPEYRERYVEYPLTKTEKTGEKLDWRVTKMRLSKDKTSLIYNQFLTLSGIPPETYEYRLGNRSALDWVIDQYQVSTDKRSGITNDPNRSDDPQYIVRLIGQVITVSLETVNVVRALPALGLPG